MTPRLYYNINNNQGESKMNIKVTSVNEINIHHVRRTWDMNPGTRTFKSKRDYNRKDKSWKRDF